MPKTTKVIEWENDNVRLIRLSGLRLHENFPYNYKRSAKYRRVNGRNIEGVFVHQLAGPFRAGISAAEGLARFSTSNPKFNPEGKKIGGGRGWPGCPYTFLVPYNPDIVGGKSEVFRLWNDDWHTWHTSRAWNKRSVAVGFAGMLKTRHSPKWSASNARDPDPKQLEAGTELITEYLLPRYGLSRDDVLGHFDSGKITCPGDVLEAWVRDGRGESVGWLDPLRAPWIDECRPARYADARDLDNWTQRQQALFDLGFDLGSFGPKSDGVDGMPGYLTKFALECFQADAGCVVDGVWGPDTEGAVRLALGVVMR